MDHYWCFVITFLVCQLHSRKYIKSLYSQNEPNIIKTPSKHVYVKMLSYPQLIRIIYCFAETQMVAYLHSFSLKFLILNVFTLEDITMKTKECSNWFVFSCICLGSYIKGSVNFVKRHRFLESLYSAGIGFCWILRDKTLY